MTDTFETKIAVDTEVPLVRIIREFAAEPARVFQAHADPNLYAKWVGPRDSTVTIDYYDCRNGGSYRYTIGRPGFEAGFRGCFHEVRPNTLIVQTFMWEGMPDGVALEKLHLEAIGNGHTLLTATSLVDSFADRDAFVASGMESGVVDGYNALDKLLAG